MTLHGRRLLILPPVVIGAVVLGWLVRGRAELEPHAPAEVTRALRVIEVPQVTLVPRVLGYGTARAGDIWKAVAEVKGRVVAVNRELKAGAVLRQGDEALRIDPAEYELLIVQLQADIAQVQAQQAEQTALEKNYQASLKIEEDSLALAQRDLARLRRLATSNSVTQSEIEKKQREELSPATTCAELARLSQCAASAARRAGCHPRGQTGFVGASPDRSESHGDQRSLQLPAGRCFA